MVSKINKTATVLSSMLLFCVLMACGNENQTTDSPNTPNSSTEATTPSNEESSTTGSEGPELKTQFPNTEFASVITLDSVNEEGTVRAQSNTEIGELVVVSSGKEEAGHLNTPSTAGVEGDLTFQGNYTVLNKFDGKEQNVTELKEITFIQQSDEPVSFDKVSFKEADVYFLTPQYTSGHGLDAYGIAINRSNGETVPLKFVKNGTTTETLNYAIGQFPVNENDTLKVIPGTSTGTSEANAETTTYKLDLVNQYFIAE